MQRADKEKLVAELAERLRGAETLIVADYRGLTVSGIDKLRGDLLEHGARFTVVKNTLTRRAAEAAGIEPLLALLDGPTAIAFLESGGDPVAVAKALDEAVRANVLSIKGGLLEGSEVSPDQVKQLAKLPPADMLRAQLAGALAGPLTTVVGLFTAPLRDLVGVLEARIQQLEEAAEPPVRESGPGEGASGEAAEPPVRESGPGEGASGEPGGSPGNEAAADEHSAGAEQPEAEAEAEPEPQPEEPPEEPQAEETQEGEEQ